MLKFNYGLRIFLDYYSRNRRGLFLQNNFDAMFDVKRLVLENDAFLLPKSIVLQGFYARMMLWLEDFCPLPCSMAIISDSCSMQLFRFDFGSIFGSINSSIEKGNEKGFEEESKLQNSSLLGSDWGYEARGQ